MAVAARTARGTRTEKESASSRPPRRPSAKSRVDDRPAADTAPPRSADRASDAARADAARADTQPRSPLADGTAAVAAFANALAGALGKSAMPGPTGVTLKAFSDALGHGLTGSAQAMAGLSLPGEVLQQVQDDYLKQATELWNRAIREPESVEVPDARFSGADWKASPWARFTAALYLLNARTLAALADNLQGDEKLRQRVRFAVQQWAAAASPANYLALNPEAQRLAVESQGKSLQSGLALLLRDLKQGHLSQTDESVFEVGRNVATTPGSVVFENPFFQLIEYHPLTEKVHERPLLIVPPCINKYYILDLQPDNSLVRYATEQGLRVFIVSWVNPDDSLAKKGWDDYVEHGVIEALHQVQAITGQAQVNTLGFCIGGTLLSCALSVLKARGEDVACSLTLLASFLDFGKTGIMDIFVDEAAVRWREATLGEQSPGGGALMKGSELAATFSFLRPTDLVWNYVVGNYLKGQTPPAFDLLFWNSDSTNLPGPMYCWYMRHTYLSNELIQPGKLTVCGQRLDLSRLDMPAFIVATKEDHIVPWESAFGSMKVLRGPRQFILGASGHIAGIVNAPSKNKRSYWAGQPAAAGASADEQSAKAWMASAQEHPGSWWTSWLAWLRPLSGKLVRAASQPGGPKHPVIEPAPGRYVKRRV